MKRVGALLGFALFVLAAASGAAPRGAALDMTGTLGGDFKVALADFGGQNPTTASAADLRVLELVYDSLGRIDPNTLEIVPWAATGWASDGAKNITVTLRTDLRFSDDTAYDADDVAYSLRQYKQNGVSRWEIFVVDAWTLRFDFQTVAADEAGPGLFFTQALTAKIAWKNLAPVGTYSYSGPFAVSSESSTRLLLVPNTHHFLGRPHLDSVEFKWPWTVGLDASGNTVANDAGCALMKRQVHLIGWALLANDLTNTRDCIAGGFGGFPGGSRESLLSTDQNRTTRHVLTAKNAGSDFLYFGFPQNPGSMFVGAPGSDGQKLRSAIYLFVNKGNYRDIEPNTAITHGVVNTLNAPWAPTSCPPWTPCNPFIEAGTIPAPQPIIRRTNTDPAVRALSDGGFVDRDGDGIRQTPGGAPIVIRLLAPSFALDPRKTTIANDMQFLFTQAGLDVTVEQFNTFGDLDAAIAGCTTSCMYVKRFMGATQLPDWLYTMPEIVNANDPQVDLHLDLGEDTCWDKACRSLHVGHVSHLIATAADFLPVLMYNALEVFDFETFAGHVNTLGGINNYATYLGLRLPATDLNGDGRQDVLSARMTIFPDLGLMPGDTTTVQAEVRDELGNPVFNATVVFTAHNGTFPGNPPVRTVTGKTDGLGIFAAEYTADSVTASVDDWITAEVALVRYTGTTATAALTVHPAPTPNLVVSVNRGPAAVIDSGNSTTITVHVADAAGAPVNGATVTVSVDLPGATISDSSGDSTGTTNSAGDYTATFTAKTGQGMKYRISAVVSSSGYSQSSAATSLIVNGAGGTVTPIDRTRNVPGFEAVSALAAVGIVFALMAVGRRRREG